jgi:glutathione S-transferase
MTEATPKIIAWRARMTARPAVRPVISAMAKYLTSVGRRVPDYAANTLS